MRDLLDDWPGRDPREGWPLLRAGWPTYLVVGVAIVVAAALATYLFTPMMIVVVP